MVTCEFKAVPWLRRLVTSVAPRRPDFALGSVHVGFVMDKLALAEVFLPSSSVFPCQYHFTVAPHTHISPEGWAIGPLIASVLRHSLSPSTWTTYALVHVNLMFVYYKESVNPSINSVYWIAFLSMDHLRVSWRCPVSIVCDCRLDEGVRYLAAEKNFFFSSLCAQTSSDAHPAPYPVSTSGPFPGIKRGLGVTLTTHPQLVLRSRISRTCICSPPWCLHDSSGSALWIISKGTNCKSV
jgi:hypothetical protein